MIQTPHHILWECVRGALFNGDLVASMENYLGFRWFCDNYYWSQETNALELPVVQYKLGSIRC